MYFYEIHEPDDELGATVLLCHEERFEPFEFFALVKKARALLRGSFEEDSLAEAIANELQRSSAFLHVTDDLLLASVSVGETDEETLLVTESGEDRTVYLSTDDDDDKDKME